MTTSAPTRARRRLPQRLTTMLWGVLVMAFGGLVIARLSGFDFDLELAGIIALAVLGAWILVSALLSSLLRRDDT